MCKPPSNFGCLDALGFCSGPARVYSAVRAPFPPVICSLGSADTGLPAKDICSGHKEDSGTYKEKYWRDKLYRMLL